MEISNRIQGVAGSKSIGVANLVSKLRAEGKEIISLNVGETDLRTPEVILQATKNALDSNETRYSFVPGLPELRHLIALKLQRDNNLQVKSENILIGNGSKQILYNIFQTLCNVGDEVIILRPYWVTFPESVKLAGGVPVFVDTVENQIDISLIEQAITSKTKAIIINSPNNPSGAVYTRKELLELADLAVKKDLTVISDEAYESLTYDDIPHISIASLGEEIFNKTITVQTFSKTYCMTGFRIGYLVAPKPLVDAVNILQSHLTGNNCTFAQFGAIAALEMSAQIRDEIFEKMQRRRDLAHKLTNQIFSCQKPQGAFYTFPNVEKFLGERFQTCNDLAMYILQEANVAILPGSAFGSPGHIRISFATNEDSIQRGLEKIAEVLL
jgi:aspartate aminotransferase